MASKVLKRVTELQRVDWRHFSIFQVACICSRPVGDPQGNAFEVRELKKGSKAKPLNTEEAEAGGLSA